MPVRLMHWLNVVAMLIMITSGWKIYNDEVIFGWLHFPEELALGRWAQHGLLWHFFGMWIIFLNGGAYLLYGFLTGRFRSKLVPIRPREVLATALDALRFRLPHDEIGIYNPVQKLLYVGVLAVGVAIVISGLTLWKPVQFSSLLFLFGNDFQLVRLIHFVCMALICGFVVVHVALALLVPKTLVAMVTGGPEIDPQAAGRH